MLTGSLRKQPGLRSPAPASQLGPRTRLHVSLCVWVCTRVRVHAEWELVCVKPCMCTCAVGICVQHARPRTPRPLVFTEQGKKPPPFGNRPTLGVDWESWLQACSGHRPGENLGALWGQPHHRGCEGLGAKLQASALRACWIPGPGGSGMGWLVGQGAEGQQNWGQGPGQGIPRSPQQKL